MIDDTINLGKCEYGEDYIDLEIGENVAEMSHSESSEEGVRRLLAFGSDRNISPRYRKDLIFDVTETKNGGNRISDMTRNLSPEWFEACPSESLDIAIRNTEDDDGTFNVTYPEAEPQQDRYEEYSHYQERVGGWETQIFEYSINQHVHMSSGVWEVALSDFYIKLAITDKNCSVSEARACINIVGIKDGNVAFNSSYEEYIPSPGSVLESPFLNQLIVIPSDITRLRIKITYYITLSALAIRWIILNGMFINKVKRYASGRVEFSNSVITFTKPTYLPIGGVIIEKIDSNGETTDRFENATFNPDRSKEVISRNWIQLPDGKTMAVGDRFRIENIVKSRVKSSYFTSRYSAYENMANITTNGIVASRLMLPESYGSPYIDYKEGLSEEQGVEDVVVFEDIYPKAVCRVVKIETIQRKETVNNDDGTSTDRTFTAYRLKDDFFTEHPFKSDYMVPGKTLEITFQDGYRYTEEDIERGTLADKTPVRDGAVKGELHNPNSGKLNGWTFEVGFLKNNNSVTWEIVRDSKYYVPNETLQPEIGDQFVLTGFDAAVVDELYVAAAEEELLRTAKKYLAKINQDATVYECKMMSDVMKEGLPLSLGTKVNLINDAFIPTTIENERAWGRKSRVIGFEIPLDIPFDSPVYSIGEKPSYSRLGAIEDDIDALNHSMSKSIAGNITSNQLGNGMPIYVISRLDTTPASDSNVYSALRAQKEFLNKLADDIASGHITFNQGLLSLATAVFKDGAKFGECYQSIYSGSGACIDKDGNAEFESVKVRSYFECLQLVVNRLSAIEGDQLLTEADTIEGVEKLNEDNCYRLKLKSKWDGYITAQAPNNVIKGIFNTLASGSGSYFTSWMRVNSVNQANNSIEVTCYQDHEVPGGMNFPPCEMMNIARWGNQTDVSRQNCLYLSSTEGRIVKLTGVTQPILDTSNISATFGSLPDFLYSYFTEQGAPVSQDEDYVYVRGLICQEILRIDKQGQPIVDYVDRGQWVENGLYYYKSINPSTGVYETSDVWYMGCKYRCCSNLTTSAPAWNSTAWAQIEGNPNFWVEFEDTDYLFNPDTFNVTLSIVAWLYNTNITDDILDADVEWTRYSEDEDGNPRIASDTVWAIRRASSGKSIQLTTADCDFNGYIPKVLRFTATVTLRDGTGNTVDTQSISFES